MTEEAWATMGKFLFLFVVCGGVGVFFVFSIKTIASMEAEKVCRDWLTKRFKLWQMDTDVDALKTRVDFLEKNVEFKK